MSILDSVKLLFKPRVISYEFYEDSKNYVLSMSPRELYETQANLHAVVNFIANSVAQLPIKCYKRISETERIRVRDSVVAKLLYKPNSHQTCYEFIDALLTEYLLYGEAIIMVLPDDSPSEYQLRIVPREWVQKRKYDTAYSSNKLYIRTNNTSNLIEIDSNQYIIFKMYRPGAPNSALSPISALKQTLTEQIEADKFRTSIWKSSGRLNSYVTRPANVTPWTPAAREAWTEAFRKGWSSGGSNAGKTLVLEDGMELKPYQFSAKEAEYIASKQLSREDVAAQFMINPSIIWHTDTQTYASAKDNARALYVECLGPILQMLQQRINSFLCPMIKEDENVYVEFDLDEKLKGSFEERASIMQSAAGGPWMSRNEVRAEYNLPPVNGGDELIVPLNVLVGGQASPQDSAPDSYSNMYSSAKPKVKEVEDELHGTLSISTESSEENINKFQSVLEKFFKRQKASISTKLKAVENWWDAERWNTELANDLYPILMSVSKELGEKIANDLKSAYYSGNTEKYLRLLAETKAKYINNNTYEAITQAQVDDVSIDDVFDTRLLMAATIAEGLSDTANEFATQEAISQAEYQGVISHPRVTKTWHTGDNPRESHAAMDGETVDYDDTFSNGLRWPHDYGPADEVAGCNCWCSVEVIY